MSGVRGRPMPDSGGWPAGARCACSPDRDPLLETGKQHSSVLDDALVARRPRRRPEAARTSNRHEPRSFTSSTGVSTVVGVHLQRVESPAGLRFLCI